MTSFLDAVRVYGAIGVLFIALPWWLARFGTFRQFGRAFVSLILFFETAALLLGRAGLCLPGSMACALLVYVFAVLLIQGRIEPVLDPTWRRRQWARLIERVAGKDEGLSLAQPKPRGSRTTVRRSFLWASPLILVAAGVAPGHGGFATADSFHRVISLQQLTLGQPWVPDGSVAFLATVVFASGVDAAGVIRITNPLLLCLAAAAAGIAVQAVVRSGFTGAMAGLIALFILISASPSGELPQAAIAAIWGLIAIAWFAEGSLLPALIATATTLLIGGNPANLTTFAIATTILLAMVCRFLSGGRRWLCTALYGLMLVGMVLGERYIPRTASTPVEYESAAVAVSKIARTFPHNGWLVVSPVQDVGFTLGRGWHMELAEFVRKYNAADAVGPTFRFTLPVQTMFVVIEKEPLPVSSLRSAALNGPNFEPELVSYQSAVDRAALEYQAGQLMEAYASTHRNLAIYFEDQSVLIYQINL